MSIPTKNLQYISFSSQFIYEYIPKKGNVYTNTSAVVNHNLGYVPFYKLYIKYPNGVYSSTSNAPSAGYITPSVGYQEFTVSSNATSTSLTITPFDETLANRFVTIYYRIYAEPQS